MKKHYRKENDCLNCGTMLEGKYCHKCGQENLQLKEKFGHMMVHAISDYFHFDHQFFHTLRPLFFKPGKLTNEYMAGRRVQYLHPVKMYIFISIVYFLLLFKEGHEEQKKDDVTVNPKLKKEQIALAEKRIDKLNLSEKQKIFAKESLQKGEVNINIDTIKDKKTGNIIKLDTNINIKSNGMGIIDGMSAGIDKNYESYEKYLSDQRKLPEDERDNFLMQYIRKKEIAYRKGGKSSNEAIVEGIKHNTPKMMFLLLPLFALVLKITFWRNHKFYVEHLIFSFHFHCFLFLFLTFMMLFDMVVPHSWGLNVWRNWLAVIFITWYIYRALRTVYHRSRFRTVTKMIGMSISYSFIFAFAFVLLALLTAITVV